MSESGEDTRLISLPSQGHLASFALHSSHTGFFTRLASSSSTLAWYGPAASSRRGLILSPGSIVLSGLLPLSLPQFSRNVCSVMGAQEGSIMLMKELNCCIASGKRGCLETAAVIAASTPWSWPPEVRACQSARAAHRSVPGNFSRAEMCTPSSSIACRAEDSD